MVGLAALPPSVSTKPMARYSASAGALRASTLRLRARWPVARAVAISAAQQGSTHAASAPRGLDADADLRSLRVHEAVTGVGGVVDRNQAAPTVAPSISATTPASLRGPSREVWRDARVAAHLLDRWRLGRGQVGGGGQHAPEERLVLVARGADAQDGRRGGHARRVARP